MRKIFIDSQSSNLFIGQRSEQAYDARALALAREGDIVITTSPIDPEYLSYWKSLGFSLPSLWNAGPYQSDKCLSTLILNNEEIKRDLSALNKEQYELHFFGTVRGVEDQLTQALGFLAYVNFDFADRYRNKEIAKGLFIESGVPTLPYVSSSDADFSFEKVVRALGKGPYLAKDNYGSGGKKLNTIFEFSNEKGFNAIPFVNFIVEGKIDLHTEIALDWEISHGGRPTLTTRRQQLSIDDSFCGTKFPIILPESLSSKLNDEYAKLVENIGNKGGLGNMSCDILIDTDMNTWWSDLNPRKAASHYVCQAVKDMMKMRGINTPYYFHHQHAHTNSSGTNIVKLRKTVKELDPSGSRFILITNPNVIHYGTVDVTAVSLTSKEDATDLLCEAFAKIGSM